MSAPRLDPDDFERFFRAVHGEEPFPWQERLSRHVMDKGWPEALDVPTGAGKTAAIDVAVFHLALEATKGAKRQAPVRILFVVDRRLVVDEAHLRAMKIASALEAATEGVLLRMKERLHLLAEQRKPPLVVMKLRGGAPKEPEWIRTPSQPVVVVSTVDQVGSRLFFRGYGVSDSMKAVHAGLLGSDALYLLDEAHLSQPFVQSVRDSRAFQVSRPWSDDATPAPFAIATLSATQTADSPSLLKSDDRKHPILGPRLRAPKPVQLVSIPEQAGSKAWIDECVARAWKLSVLGGGDAGTTAVVVNRVGRARAIYAALAGRLGDSPAADVALLIGPARPLERDARVRDLLPRMAARREGAAGARPLLVVATQCIEAGADLDFDAMLTELAPLDCLRQRFGRLNRTGRSIDAKGVVVVAAGQVGGRSEPDAIYGGSPAATWELLSAKAETHGNGKNKSQWIDFGIEGSEKWLPDKKLLDSCVAGRANAPVMMPAFIEQWGNTSPRPLVDPEVSLFLHGPRARPPDVQLVWRADLTVSAPDEVWTERVTVCPPSVLEAIAVPLHVARAWLLSQEPSDVADVECSSPADDHGRIRAGRRALRWRGPADEDTRPIWPDRIGPGDMLVVPAAYGGCDQWGWAPDAPGPVRDLGAEANRLHRRLDVLRFTTQIVELAWREKDGIDEEGSRVHAARLDERLASLRDESDTEVRDVLASDEHVPLAWRQRLGESAGRLERDAQGTPLAFVSRVRMVHPSVAAQVEPVGAATTEDDLSPRSLKAVPLPSHSGRVRDYARRFAEQLGFSGDLSSDVALAAFLHDAGKAHPDFKRWLYGGDELAVFAAEDLAKSGRRLGPMSRARAGLPIGARHEVASLSLAPSHPAFREARDPDLVLWLIGTHHGYGRPFFSPVEWPLPGATFSTDLGGGMVQSGAVPRLAALTSRWCDIQARLTRKYGPWGLARLEAVLRLADHRGSESEEEET